MTSATTKADQAAELKRQAFVISEVERAHAEELPALGEDNGVPKDVVRSATSPVRTTELAKAKGG